MSHTLMVNYFLTGERSMFKWSLQLLASLFLSGIVGCSHHITVQQKFVAQDHLVPKINAQSPVTVIGKPPKTSGMIKFCKAGPNTFYASYDEFTHYAVKSTEDILARNDIQVLDSAEKQLIVSISEATCKDTMGGVKFEMTLNCSMGQNSSRQFSGYQHMGSMHGINFALTAATLNAVLEMFNDEEVRHYISQK